MYLSIEHNKTRYSFQYLKNCNIFKKNYFVYFFLSNVILIVFCSVASKHINRSMNQLLSQKSICPNNRSSLLQRVLSLDPSNPKFAQILSLDMFIVGIDTVKSYIIICMHLLFLIIIN